jgi:hypothetical protein
MSFFEAGGIAAHNRDAFAQSLHSERWGRPEARK